MFPFRGIKAEEEMVICISAISSWLDTDLSR